jgi:tetratricopeptide (TPR) repeat protein
MILSSDFLISQPNVMKRYIFSLLILIFSASGFYHLSLRLISQIHYHRAGNAFQDGDYKRAASLLNEAARYQPNDDAIHRESGKAYFKLGESEQNWATAFLLAKISRDAYLRASRLNPLDAETAYGLAVSETRLEQLYQYQHPEDKKNPYQALPYYKAAIRLRPNGVQYNDSLARYLYMKGNTDELPEVIRNLGRIYPASYSYLKKEPFWSELVRQAFKQGLEDAIGEEITVRNSHMILSAVFADEENWTAAIFHYQEALNHQSFQNSSGNYIQLGRLCLKDKQFEPAENSFLHALELSSSREKTFETLYSVYRAEGYPEKFYAFYHRAGEYFILSYETDIVVARCLADLKEYEQAKQVLKDLNQKYTSAEAYYWLCHIAQQEADWDAAELAIQKATVIDPANSQYHFIFSNILKRLKKLERAEKEAGLAIEHQEQRAPWIFNHRAWIRWSQENYAGAVEDWKAAIELKPDHAAFYAQIAEAYKKLEKRSLAWEYYEKAIKIDPNNARYTKAYSELKLARQ